MAEHSPQFGVAVRAAETGTVIDLLVGHQFLQRINRLLAGHTRLSDWQTEALHTRTHTSTTLTGNHLPFPVALIPNSL